MLELEGPRPLWQGAGHDGVLTLPSGEAQPVMVLLGPESPATDGLARARKAARVALTLRHPGVARLVSVTEYGSRVAWCYERVEGLGMVHVTSRDDVGGLGARAAAELVAQVAEVLLALGGPGLHHPGPQPSDLIIQSDGHVRILGFAGPFPQDPSMRPPHPDAVEPGAVYRLGVLLAALLGGSTPSPASDASAHEVLVRRALIRAMSRPGPVLSDRYGQWIRHMLAWAPAERPPLSAVPAGLRSVGWATGGPGLGDWATQAVPDLGNQVLLRTQAEPLPQSDDLSDPGVLRSIAESGPPPPRRVVEPSSRTATPTAEHRLSGELERADDDVTQEATFDPEENGPPSPRAGRPPSRPDTIPVDIGPPAEALKKRPPTLPAGFLGTDSDEDTDEEPTSATKPVRRWPAVDRRVAFGWGGAALGLLILAMVFLAYLCWGPPETPAPTGPPPLLRDTLEPGPTRGASAPDAERPAIPSPDAFEVLDTDPPEDTDPPAAPVVDASRAPRVPDEVSVLFRLAGGQRGRIYVSCEPTVVTRQGMGQVRLTLRRGDVCEVGTKAPDGSLLRVRDITVTDYATVDCFANWESTCLQ